MKKGLLTNQEIASFCSQAALLFHAGITPLESISIMQEDSKDANAVKILSAILEQLEAGEKFHTGLEATHVFPDYMLNMVKLGEESGNLDEVTQSLADYYEREQEIATNIKNAVTYPFIMIAMMVLVLLVLITKVIPIFNQVFLQLGSEMTGVSHSLLVLGQALNRYSIAVVIILVLIVILFLLATKTTSGRKHTARILSKIPFMSRFYEKIAAGRFASGMALALSSGLDTFSSLAMVKNLVEHKRTEDRIDQCASDLEAGANFGEALSCTGIFSSTYSRMVTVGFKTGSVDQIMKKIAASYEQEVDRKIQSIIAVIEPTLVIVLSVIVGLILLSVILPLMGVMSSIG